jgi:serine/threonine-protein kinase
VHRDLSPANVRVTPADEIKLVDFGLAKVLSEHSPALGKRTMVTAVGSLLGTAPWMAPEQFGSRPVDARTDIHALGALLFYLAVGRQPFEGRNLLMVMQAIEAPERPRPGAAGSRCGELFDALVTACLARDPAARPQSAAEVARVLEGLLHETG